MLAAIYVGLIFGLRTLVLASTGSLLEQPLVLSASTVGIAALFQPLRRRVQATIDGRLFRRKYDAAKVIAAFSSMLSLAVDLEQIREQVVAVIEEKMHPTIVSMWLRAGSMER